MNKMKEIKVEKITLNIGTGKDQEKLKKALILLEKLTSIKPIKTITNKRIATWSLRPGLPIGCKVTVRDQRKKDIIIRLLSAKDNLLSKRQIPSKRQALHTFYTAAVCYSLSPHPRYFCLL